MSYIKRISFILLSFIINTVVYADFKQGGVDYKNGDYESAITHFKIAAEKSDHRAMYALGSMYAGGQGVERDYKQAYIWFRKAEKFGRTDAQYKLGLMYEQGLGLKVNYKKAIKWYGKSANGGYSPAWYKLGMMYAEGKGVKQNNVKAHAWLNAALPVFKQGQTDQKEKEELLEEESQDPTLEIEMTLAELEKVMSAEEHQAAMELLTKIRKRKR